MEPSVFSVGAIAQIICSAVLGFLAYGRRELLRGRGPLFWETGRIVGILGVIGSLACFLSAFSGSGFSGIRGGGKATSEVPTTNSRYQSASQQSASSSPANGQQFHVPELIYWCNQCGALDDQPIIHRNEPSSARAKGGQPSLCPANKSFIQPGQPGSKDIKTPIFVMRLSKFVYRCPECEIMDGSPILHVDESEGGGQGWTKGPSFPPVMPEPVYWCNHCGALDIDPIIHKDDPAAAKALGEMEPLAKRRPEDGRTPEAGEGVPSAPDGKRAPESPNLEQVAAVAAVASRPSKGPKAMERSQTEAEEGAKSESRDLKTKAQDDFPEGPLTNETTVILKFYYVPGYCYSGKTEDGTKCVPNATDHEWVTAGLLVDDFEQDLASGEDSEDSPDLEASRPELYEKYRSQEFADLRRKLESIGPKLVESDNEPLADMYYSQTSGLSTIPKVNNLKEYLKKIASLSEQFDLNYEVYIDPIHHFSVKKELFARTMRRHGKPRFYCRKTKINDRIKIMTGVGLCFTRNFEPKDCPAAGDTCSERFYFLPKTPPSIETNY